MASSSSSSSGIGFFGLITISFIVLKLGGVISWSWWLVLLPAYGPPMVFITFFAVMVALTQSRKR